MCVVWGETKKKKLMVIKFYENEQQKKNKIKSLKTYIYQKEREKECNLKYNDDNETISYYICFFSGDPSWQ